MKKTIKPGKVIFAVFILIIIAMLFLWARDSVHNQQTALDRTAYIDGINVPGR